MDLHERYVAEQGFELATPGSVNKCVTDSAMEPDVCSSEWGESGARGGMFAVCQHALFVDFLPTILLQLKLSKLSTLNLVRL